MGESLTDMPMKDLKNLETKLEKAITRIRSKKVASFAHYIVNL